MNRTAATPDARAPAAAPKHRYRPDIDGLRAVAVLSVLVFHLEPSWLPGGYLGVDIFFVISGFLITGILLREQAAGTFSLARFYERRVRRIMPALLLVLLLTTVASVVLLLPLDLLGYGKSLLATLAFAANIYFFLDTNYFSAAAELKPLLHMWSLGVEEQFYLFFPLILMALARFPRAIAPTVVALTVLSLLANMGALFVNKANPAFFLIPFRAWELGFGAMLAVALQGASDSRARPVLALLGAILVVIGLAEFNPLAALSVPVALSAVLGTTLLIYAHHGGTTPVGRVLASRPAVFVGLISYSLYLWHWPMIVLPRYYLVREFTPLEAACAALAAIALATFSLKVVEQPFRRKTMSVPKLLGITGGLTAVAAVAGVAVLMTNGLPDRLDPKAAAINAAVGTHYRCRATSYIPFGALYACPMALPSGDPADADTVLFGNSHAQMYVPAVTLALEQHGRRGLLVPANGCLPTLDVNLSRDCERTMRGNLQAIAALENVRTVMIAFNWNVKKRPLVDASGRALDGDNPALIQAGVARAIDAFRAAGKQVVLVGPIATPGYDIASEVSRKLAFGHEIDDAVSTPQAAFLAPHGPALAAFAERADVTLLEPHGVQCRDNACWFIDDGESLFADGNHLAGTVAERFAPLFFEALTAN